jgi:hypothetical protein
MLLKQARNRELRINDILVKAASNESSSFRPASLETSNAGRSRIHG